jgi:hypothetical protein
MPELPRRGLLWIILPFFSFLALHIQAGDNDSPFYPPGDFGPYPVGYIQQTINDPQREGRTLNIDIWYPASTLATHEKWQNLDQLRTIATMLSAQYWQQVIFVIILDPILPAKRSQLGDVSVITVVSYYSHSRFITQGQAASLAKYYHT